MFDTAGCTTSRPRPPLPSGGLSHADRPLQLRRDAASTAAAKRPAAVSRPLIQSTATTARPRPLNQSAAAAAAARSRQLCQGAGGAAPAPQGARRSLQLVRHVHV